MKILLIVDVQNDFCPGGSLAVEDGDKTIPVINNLMNEGGYDLIVASQDYHPANHVSFGQWPVHCVQGSTGVDFHPDLQIELIDKFIQKGSNPNIDSYSAFFDNEHVQDTGLFSYIQDQLKLNNQTLQHLELHVVGLALDYCVKFSAIDAANLGIKTFVLFDATKAVNLNPGDIAKGIPSDEESALLELTNAGVEIMTSNQVLGINRETIPVNLENKKDLQRGLEA